MYISNESLWFLAAVLALGVSGVVRVAFLLASVGSSVDHYYWILAARAYRGTGELPVRIPGKYILEDERQAYPPGFAKFLALFSDDFLSSTRSTLIVVVVDLITLALVLVAGIVIGLSPSGLVAIILVYGLAPVLVAYNTQLTSRGLGNLFLVLSLFSQTAAAVSTGVQAYTFSLIGVFALGAVFLTHKMTTQFFVFLWPFWLLALISLDQYGHWIGMLTPLAALALATIVTGAKFQLLQWRAHWDIIAFWHRNWRFLGAHQFRQSPLYGDASLRAHSVFHGPGLTGAWRHAMLLVAYLPAALPLPAMLLFAPAPPAYIIVWFAAAMLAALATLYIPALKCLGGGHLYVFNAVPPSALWWGFVLSDAVRTVPVTVLFGLAFAATVLSLVAGFFRRSRRAGAADADVSALVAWLARVPTARVAAFPVTYAERIALETKHTVFWGGHGLGFRTLEPYWPVMREPVGEALRRWGVTCAILDLDWWPEGEAIFAADIGDATPKRFGRFAVYRMKP